jgi:hypothetical protein
MVVGVKKIMLCSLGNPTYHLIINYIHPLWLSLAYGPNGTHNFVPLILVCLSLRFIIRLNMPITKQ